MRVRDQNWPQVDARPRTGQRRFVRVWIAHAADLKPLLAQARCRQRVIAQAMLCECNPIWTSAAYLRRYPMPWLENQARGSELIDRNGLAGSSVTW